MFDSFDFPDAPKYRAKWKPIYFEPIVNSGERVTILIVVKDENSIKYYEALHESVIDSLYGAKSVAFKNLVKYIKEQLIKNSGELNNCIEGFTLVIGIRLLQQILKVLLAKVLNCLLA